ncbi:MAG: DUF4339 domain-containing protein [Labilithrix sp.]
MSNDVWRWADPEGQQRRVRLDELRAALAGGHIAANTPVWRPGWPNWQSAHEVPELTSASLGGAHGVVLNIPPPPLAMVAVQQSYEKQSESMAPAPPSMAPAGPEPEPPVPPPRYVPVASKMPSMHPASSSSSVNIATQIGGSSGMVLAAPPVPNFAPPASTRAPSVAPPVPPNIPTTLGMPAPTIPLGAPESAEELSDSNLLEPVSEPNLRTPVKTASRLTPDPNVQPPPSNPDLLAPLFLHDKPPGVVDQLVADLKALKSGQSPNNKPVLIAAGVMTVMLFIGLVAVVISLASGGTGSAKTVASASASPSGKVPPPPTTIASAVTTTSAPVAAPPPPATPSVVLGECKVSGDPKLVAPRAVSAAAIETQALSSGLALGFAASPRDAVATMLDPVTFAPTTTFRTKPGGDVKRVTPFLNGTRLSALVDVDRKGDKLGSRRSVATSPLADVGVSEGALVWAPHGRDSSAKLFALDGDAPVEALRAIPLADKHGLAVTFRRDNAIRIGVARGDQTLEADGELSKIDGLGQGAGTLGSPSITSSGDRVVVAWADRASTDGEWTVRWTTVKPHESKHEATALTAPPGGLGGNVMSPNVASLGGGRFLLAWTEGATTNHQVRALTFAADGTPSSTPLSISASGDNAGQPAIALNDEGKGVVAYLSAKGKGGFDLHVTPISCPRQ